MPQETTTQEDIRASIEQLEKDDQTPDPAASPGAPADAGPDEGGEPATSSASSATPGSQGAAPAAGTGVPVSELRMPASYRPTMSERWKTTPREIQEEILRRETEIMRGLQTAADHRKFKEEFDKVVGPYSQFIAAHGRGNPLGAFNDYLATATLLRTGSPVEKANAVAMAIHEYGVDVQMLDAALAQVLQGRRPVPARGGQPQEFRDPRVDELLQAQEAEVLERASTELETFQNDPKNEHYHEVKEEMADILEFEAARGKKVTLQQAYDRACKSVESVATKISQKKAQESQLAGARKVASAKKAATPGAGLAPAGAASSVSKDSGSLSDDIRASIEKLESAS